MEDLEGFQNYLRLDFLLNEGSQALRKIFQNRYKELTGADWKDGETHSQHFKNTIGSSYFESALPTQRKLIKQGNLNCWDLTMLSNILSSIPLKSRNKTNHQNPNQFRKKINQLKDIRNKLAHLGGKSVSKEDYPNLWKNLSSIVISLGVDPEHVEKIRTCTNFAGIEFQNLGAINPENTEKAVALKIEGNSLVSKGEWTKSIKTYSKALELFGVSDSERGILYSNRSHSWLKSAVQNKQSDDLQQKLSRALDDAKKSVDLRPSWWKGYFRAGQVHQHQKQWECAILYYNQALALAPESTTAEIQTLKDECRIQLRNAEEADQKTMETKIDRNSKLWSESRIQLQLKQRTHIPSIMKVMEMKYKTGFSILPPEKQKNPLKLSDLKDIRLSQVEEIDKVYSGFVINLTVIEDPIMRFYDAVHAICRDDNWDVKHCVFYNVDGWSRITKFVFGSKLTVLNPYFRQGTDGTHALRVDDPNSIIFQGCLDEEDGEGRLCRFCWTVGAKFQCSKCKKVNYCDKDCQTADCKILNHKLVCDPDLLAKI